MIWEARNFSLMDPADKDRSAKVAQMMAQVKSGDTFIDCNLSQLKFKKIFKKLTGLIFIDCNTTNCDLPTDTKAARCNTSINEYEEVDKVPKFKKNDGKKHYDPADRKKFFKENELKNVQLKRIHAKEIAEAKA